jgi:hypothetical protein
MKKERLTGTLSRPNRPLESFLAEAGFEGAIIQQTVPWCNRLENEARHWILRGGLFSSPCRIHKKDADHALRAALAELAKGGAI